LLTLLVQVGVKQIPMNKLAFLSKINVEEDKDDNFVLRLRSNSILFYDD
jgi:hypothetical protein